MNTSFLFLHSATMSTQNFNKDWKEYYKLKDINDKDCKAAILCANFIEMMNNSPFDYSTNYIPTIEKYIEIVNNFKECRGKYKLLSDLKYLKWKEERLKHITPIVASDNDDLQFPDEEEEEEIVE